MEHYSPGTRIFHIFIKIGFFEKELHKTGTVNIQLWLEEEFLRLLPSLPNCDKQGKKKNFFRGVAIGK